MWPTYHCNSLLVFIKELFLNLNCVPLLPSLTDFFYGGSDICIRILFLSSVGNIHHCCILFAKSKIISIFPRQQEKLIISILLQQQVKLSVFTNCHCVSELEVPELWFPPPDVFYNKRVATNSFLIFQF